MFTDYVSHFYHLKTAGKKMGMLSYFTKNCLNSLYGRFGTRISKYNALHVAMAVGAYARVQMALYRQSYFFYSDTDSVLVPNKMSNRFVSDNIGMMKLVTKVKDGFFLVNYYTYTTDTGKKVLKARGMIKRIAPEITDLMHNFKLLYYKRNKHSVYLHETIYNYKYKIDNFKHHEIIKKYIGSDFFSKFI